MIEIVIWSSQAYGIVGRRSLHVNRVTVFNRPVCLSDIVNLRSRPQVYLDSPAA